MRMDEKGFVWQRDAGPVLSHFYTAAGVIVAGSQALTYAQMRVFEAEQKARFTQLEAEFRQGFTKLDCKVSNLAVKVDALKADIETLGSKVDSKVESIDAKLELLTQGLGKRR